MSYNNILDVGLDNNNDSIEKNTENLETESSYETLNEDFINNEKLAVINPYKFSERHLLDEKKGLDNLSSRVQESLKSISKKKNNDDIYDEIVKTYRLWTHQLNPKYKLKDTITLINRVGKSKDITVYRRMKINEDNLSKLNDFKESNDGGETLSSEVVTKSSGTEPKTLMEKLADDERALEAMGDSVLNENLTTELNNKNENIIEANNKTVTQQSIVITQEQSIDEYNEMMQAEADFYEQNMM
ncbi:hypothetical protein HANVADRAFT_83766 [Hanseniaspora valbyensis NRRL Y-1626]|uniref:Chromosome segregation in meiosis protein 3 domain-containing protein n=1 Tax=Hanseniaspora valbyensis NRRL Y-1626 TaxID=766949 RepID=A0A1B7TJ82_9ASCO|nr:hypothetical protein HANVADRAFT_83766 [Hanseniaspora valbyensis NRRL Y-1626]